MKIAICGSFGTGKTTLMEKLELEGLNKIIDLEREVIGDRNIKDLNQEDINLEIYNSIIGWENRYDNFITNTSRIDNLAYSFKFANKLFNVIKNTPINYDIIFYLPIEFGLETDGIRHEDKILQIDIDNIIKLIIQTHPRVIVISGTVEERINKIKQILGESKR